MLKLLVPGGFAPLVYDTYHALLRIQFAYAWRGVLAALARGFAALSPAPHTLAAALPGYS
jgi:hypothetical protein